MASEVFAMYGVIVCTKCRMHAQIIEVGSSRTVQCQRCGARLEVRKLQLISTSENRDEVVAARTIIQAKIQASGLVHATHAQSFQCSSSQNNSPIEAMHLRSTATNRKVRSRDPAKMILENISDEGEMSIEELKEKCTISGIGEDVFEKSISMLLDAGDIYSPAKGKVKKV